MNQIQYTHSWYPVDTYLVYCLDSLILNASNIESINFSQISFDKSLHICSVSS